MCVTLTPTEFIYTAGMESEDRPSVTIEEKAAAFDVVALALTNQWYDGSWTWWASAPCGGLAKRATREEAVQDLIEWSQKKAKRAMRIHIPVGLPLSGQPGDGGQLHGDSANKPDDPGGAPAGDSGDVRGQGDIPGSPDGVAGKDTPG